MFSTGDLFAVARIGDRACSRRDGSIQRRIVPQRADGVVPRLDVRFAREACGRDRHPFGDRQHASAAAGGHVASDDVRQRAAIADDGRNRVDHRFRGDAAERFFPDRRDDEDARQREIVRRRRYRGRRHDLWVLAEVDAGDRVQRSAAVPRLHDEDRNVGAPRSEHVGETREQQQALVRRRVDERHEGARFGWRHDRRPVDRRLERRADQSDFLAVHAGEELAARERVIDVLEISALVVAEAADGKGRGDAAPAGFGHRREDHRVSVAGDQLIRSEAVELARDDFFELRSLGAIGPRLVVVPRHEQRDRNAFLGVAHDGTPLRRSARGEERSIDALLRQVILDRENHRALEASRRHDAARMTRIREPLHDRAETLRDARGRIADAVIVHEEKPHD